MKTKTKVYLFAFFALVLVVISFFLDNIILENTTKIRSVYLDYFVGALGNLWIIILVFYILSTLFFISEKLVILFLLITKKFFKLEKSFLLK